MINSETQFGQDDETMCPATAGWPIVPDGWSQTPTMHVELAHREHDHDFPAPFASLLPGEHKMDDANSTRPPATTG
ncbi:MAG: hypothetical protein ABIY39_00045 [Sphingomonas sp.]|uniref:Uncharacterized protein n=1 Tax=hydrothermal vent metagenome TaxID=652676 RepID=A0A170PP73_9ZZZZ